MPALIIPCSDLDCGQPQGHHAVALSQRYQAPGNNYVKLCDATSTAHQFPRQLTHLHFRKLPELFRHHLEKQEMSHCYDGKSAM